MSYRFLAALLLACLLPWSAFSQSSFSSATDEYYYTWPDSNDFDDFHKDFLVGHIDIGIRFINYEFDRSREAPNAEDLFYDDPQGHYIEGYFIGSIDELREDPERGIGFDDLFITWHPLADLRQSFSESEQEEFAYLFCLLEGLGLEVSGVDLRGETWTSMESEPDGNYSDGTVIAEGLVWTLLLTIKNPTIITPYIGIGFVNFSDPDVTEGWWHWGFNGSTWVEADAAYRAWRDAGSPGDPNGGVRRTFTVDGSRADVFVMGATLELHESWQLDFYYRQMDVVFDNTFTITSGDTHLAETRYSKWDLSHTAYGFGLRYSF